MVKCIICPDVANYYCTCNEELLFCQNCYSEHKKYSGSNHFKREIEELGTFGILKINTKRIDEARVILMKKGSVLIKKTKDKISELLNKIKSSRTLQQHTQHLHKQQPHTSATHAASS